MAKVKDLDLIGIVDTIENDILTMEDYEDWEKVKELMCILGYYKGLDYKGIYKTMKDIEDRGDVSFPMEL